MGIISEVKCSRCDRQYSGVRSRCPYCGARRIGRGKYSEEGNDAKGKMLVGILIMVVLVVASAVLLAITPNENPQDEIGSDILETETSGLGDESGNIKVTNEETPEETSPTETEEETPTATTPVPIQSVTITYAGSQTVDFSEPRGREIPLVVKIEPAGAEFNEEIEWISSDITVFEVVKTTVDGTHALVTIIGSSGQKAAVLTVRVGGIEAKCDVRVSG